MKESMTATKSMQEQIGDCQDDRSLQKRVALFTEKWSIAMDLNKRDASEFSADLVMVVQAVHRDANRETHALLVKAISAFSLSAVPPPSLILRKEP